MKKSVFGKILLFLVIAALSSAFYLYKEKPEFFREHIYNLVFADRFDPKPEVMLNGAPASLPAILASLDDKLTVNVDKAPDRAGLKILDTDSGQVVLEQQAALPDLPLPKRNGSFKYELTMEWTGEENQDKGSHVLEIPVKLDLPEKFVFSAQPPAPGQQSDSEQPLKLAQGQLLEVEVYYADDPRTLSSNNPSMINSGGIRRTVFSGAISPQITM